MNISVIGTTVHVDGNWTLSGMTVNTISSMSHVLQLLDVITAKIINIDCHQICDIDINRMQIFNVWITCARLRGIGTKLVNIPYEMMNLGISTIGNVAGNITFKGSEEEVSTNSSKLVCFMNISKIMPLPNNIKIP